MSSAFSIYSSHTWRVTTLICSLLSVQFHPWTAARFYLSFSKAFFPVLPEFPPIQSLSVLYFITCLLSYSHFSSINCFYLRFRSYYVSNLKSRSPSPPNDNFPVPVKVPDLPKQTPSFSAHTVAVSVNTPHSLTCPWHTGFGYFSTEPAGRQPIMPCMSFLTLI